MVAGLETLGPVMSAQMLEYEAAGVTFDTGQVEAHREGTVGWVAARPVLTLADGSTVTVRFTGVLHLDLGVWRFVQWQFSRGVENAETVGFEMTTTVEHLAAAVQWERPDLDRHELRRPEREQPDMDALQNRADWRPYFILSRSFRTDYGTTDIYERSTRSAVARSPRNVTRVPAGIRG